MIFNIDLSTKPQNVLNKAKYSFVLQRVTKLFRRKTRFFNLYFKLYADNIVRIYYVEKVNFTKKFFKTI